ncbi:MULTISPECIES: S9 family peptidase [unclassified Actinomyces]|uniref:alpha/beta hydrolase family protein n=1 Tax=unclassified Actinomyces TaxID=2609248 RepID=UPI000D58CBD3|nr:MULTISPECIES: prolyl oligopeptidase family serine peptidase [unclassified Actinomyces]RAX24602.1 hypothetical protein DRB07_00740 [Actinomyces sp. Z3]
MQASAVSVLPAPQGLLVNSDPDLVNYVGAHDAPMFIWHCADDPVVDPRETTALVAALQAADVPCEYHLFAHGGHGPAAQP